MANNKEFDFIKMFYDIRKVCLTEDHCGTCKENGCLVGFARNSIGQAKQKDTDTLNGRFKEIPAYDINGGYDMQDALEAVAHTLQQCRSCRDNHTGDCLVNIVRACYEVIAFGDVQDYNGSTLMYLAGLSEKHPEAAAIISEVYQSHTNPMDDTL